MSLEEEWAKADPALRRMIRDLAKYPTERNTCYAIGWLGCHEHHTGQSQGFWIALAGQIQKHADHIRTLPYQ